MFNAKKNLKRLIGLKKLTNPARLDNETKARIENCYPQGKTLKRFKIISCSNPDYWYADRIGETVKLHYFGSYGAWDEKSRWVDYWDVRQL